MINGELGKVNGRANTCSSSRCSRQVTTEEAEKRAQEFNVMFIETSAKAGHNVKTLFKKIAQALPGMDKDSQQDGATGNKSEFLHDGKVFLLNAPSCFF